ncbi:MAG: type II toxin-antitoxin system VapC family toxin [candidate division NC10 bacterium]|nr:type II toxin-antitoxin system VapC family toxin [candidate division NC10 bacterium]
MAVATVHGIDYLLTWNCRHIANAESRSRIVRACRLLGYAAPILCTPEELMGG